MTAIETIALQAKNGLFRRSGISLLIPSGQITAIIGPNGSGKSTFLNLIAGLLAPGSGSIMIQGKQSADYTRTEFARTLSMLPQFREMLPELTVRELVAYGRAPYRGAFRHQLSEADEEMVDWAMKLTGVRRHEDRMVGTLSGGERQKALIAMVLAQKTGIILLDEPTASLDIAHQLDLMLMLMKINREHGLTIVMVLHDLQQAAAFCQHLIAIKEGEIAAQGPPQTVITPGFLRTVYDIEAEVRFDEAYPLIIPKFRPDTEVSEILIVTNTGKLVKGAVDQLLERVDPTDCGAGMPGFLGLEVLMLQNNAQYDEISFVTRWRSSKDYHDWLAKEIDHMAGKQSVGSDYVISSAVTLQALKIKRAPIKSE